MIKNERQYRITQARIEEFRQAIAQWKDERHTSKLHPRLQQAQADALRSQLHTLERELREYDELRSGRRKVLTYESFDELLKALSRHASRAAGRRRNSPIDLGWTNRRSRTTRLRTINVRV